MAYRRRTQSEWQSLVKDQAGSGLSAKAFCADQGIGVASFYQWRKRLTTDGVHALPDEPFPFVDVSALASQVSQQETGAPAWLVELELGNGLVLRLNRG
jgi:hypothetical protein